MIYRAQSRPAKRLITGLGSGSCPRCVAQNSMRNTEHLPDIDIIGVIQFLHIAYCLREQQEGHWPSTSSVCTGAILFTSFDLLTDTGCKTLKTMYRPMD